MMTTTERNGVWTLLGTDVVGASALTQFPLSFGVGGKHINTP
jgi:hypothetical protein